MVREEEFIRLNRCWKAKRLPMKSSYILTDVSPAEIVKPRVHPGWTTASWLKSVGKSLARNCPDLFLQDAARKLFSATIRRPKIFGFFLDIGVTLKSIAPFGLVKKVYKAEQADLQWPNPRHTRKMVALAGCAQSAMSPSTNLYAAKVLDRVGISLLEVSGAGCCGSLDLHTTSEDKAREVARNLIDRWYPLLDDGVEAFVMTASGCGAAVKEYPHLFRHDPKYLNLAKAIAEKTWDLSEILEKEEIPDVNAMGKGQTVAFHAPCTLQHGQKLTGTVERILERAGYRLLPVRDSHLCCGSAGSYSLFQAKISEQLRNNKWRALQEHKPDIICTANIGCQAHLSHTDQKVKHWIELLV